MKILNDMILLTRASNEELSACLFVPRFGSCAKDKEHSPEG